MEAEIRRTERSLLPRQCLRQGRSARFQPALAPVRQSVPRGRKFVGQKRAQGAPGRLLPFAFGQTLEPLSNVLHHLLGGEKCLRRRAQVPALRPATELTQLRKEPDRGVQLCLTNAFTGNLVSRDKLVNSITRLAVSRDGPRNIANPVVPKEA